MRTHIPAAHLSAVQLSFRAAIAAAISVFVAQALHLPFPLYAMIAAVIVTDLAPAETRKLAWRRLAGTVVGAGLGAVASLWLVGSALAILVCVLVAMLLCHFLRLDGAARLSGYICGIVLLEHTAEPWTYAVLRLLETTIGIAAAVVVSFVPKLLHLGPDQPASTDP